MTEETMKITADKRAFDKAEAILDAIAEQLKSESGFVDVKFELAEAYRNLGDSRKHGW